MKVAIMQPYFLPYIGYFQLINEVDVFVIYDDVNYIKKGWINRNRIAVSGVERLITLPLKDASQNKKINELYISEVPRKLMKTIEQEYSGSRSFDSAWPVFEETMRNDELHLVAFLERQLMQLCSYLGICTKWVRASALGIDKGKKGQDRILSICKDLGASHYVNLSGGKHLYEQKSFNEFGLELSFVSPNDICYAQKSNIFFPNLSILDVIMSCSITEISKFLASRTLE